VKTLVERLVAPAEPWPGAVGGSGGGPTADLPRRRRVLLAGLGVFAVSSPAAGLATSVALLIAARAVQTLGTASIAPAALALMMTLFHSTIQG
jgi:MFS family permease